MFFELYQQWYVGKRTKHEPDDSAASAVTTSGDGVLPTMIPAAYRTTSMHPQYVYSTPPAPAHANGASPLPAHQGSVVDVKSPHNGSAASPAIEYASSLPHKMSTVTSGAAGGAISHSYHPSLGKCLRKCTFNLIFYCMSQMLVAMC